MSTMSIFSDVVFFPIFHLPKVIKYIENRNPLSILYALYTLTYFHSLNIIPFSSVNTEFHRVGKL